MRFIERNFDYDEATDFAYRVQSLLTGDLWAVPAYGWHSDDTSRQPVVGGWFILDAEGVKKGDSQSEAFYRRIAEIQAASPDTTEITARCSGGGTTWTEDHHFNTIADAVQFAWSDEPYQRGIVTIDGKEWYV